MIHANNPLIVDELIKALEPVIRRIIREGLDSVIDKQDEPDKTYRFGIAVNGKQKKKRRFGSAKKYIKIADDFDKPLEDFRDYM